MAAKSAITPSAYFIKTKIANCLQKTKLLARIQKEYEIYEYFASVRPLFFTDQNWEMLLFNIPESIHRLRYIKAIAYNQKTNETSALEKLAAKEKRYSAMHDEKKKHNEGAMGYGPAAFNLYEFSCSNASSNNRSIDSNFASSLRVEDMPKIVFDFRYVGASDVDKLSTDYKTYKFLLKSLPIAININCKKNRPFPVEFVNADLDNQLVAEFLNSMSSCGDFMKGREYDRPNVVNHPVIHKGNPYEYVNSETDHSKEIIYVSHHAHEMLDGPLLAGTYIIPVTGDKGRETLQCRGPGNYHLKRVPVDKYTRWSTKRPKVLKFDQLLNIFSDVYDGYSWKDALFRHISPNYISNSPFEKKHMYDTTYPLSTDQLYEIHDMVNDALGESEGTRTESKKFAEN